VKGLSLSGLRKLGFRRRGRTALCGELLFRLEAVTSSEDLNHLTTAPPQAFVWVIAGNCGGLRYMMHVLLRAFLVRPEADYLAADIFGYRSWRVNSCWPFCVRMVLID
jgi:hypothetical protein